MAANYNPGDAVGLDATMATLKTVVQRCESAGIDNYVLDPGVGYWSPLRSLDNDWDLCQNYERFSEFNRPVLAAISRKSFIGNLVKKEPEGRLAGSLAVTMVLLQKGASVVRTHDVPQTRDLISVFERMVKRP
jgi:dihydropteroate synthase